MQLAKVGPIFLLWPFKKGGKNKFASLAHFTMAFTRLLTRPSLMDFVCITSSVNDGVRWIINRVAEGKKKKERNGARFYLFSNFHIQWAWRDAASLKRRASWRNQCAFTLRHEGSASCEASVWLNPARLSHSRPTWPLAAGLILTVYCSSLFNVCRRCQQTICGSERQWMHKECRLDCAAPARIAYFVTLFAAKRCDLQWNQGQKILQREALALFTHSKVKPA